MKNFITILTVSILTISTVFATTTPNAELVRVDNLELFETAEYNVGNESLDFVTKSDISMIQIFDLDGELAFQLPVMSSNVQLKKSLFESGSQKISFIMKDSNQIHSTKITVKN